VGGAGAGVGAVDFGVSGDSQNLKWFQYDFFGGVVGSGMRVGAGVALARGNRVAGKQSAILCAGSHL